MKILAIIYLVFIAFSLISEPFLFGKEKGLYTPTKWLLSIMANIGLIYLLVNIITK